MPRLLCSLAIVLGSTFCCAAGCARGRLNRKVAYVEPPLPTSQPSRSTLARHGGGPTRAPTSKPATAVVDDRQALSVALSQAMADPRLLGARVSVFVRSLDAAVPSPLFARLADDPRVPASNAKLLTTTAAAAALRAYRFVTEVSQRRPGGPLYVWGTGDPLLTGKDIVHLARQLQHRGLRTVRGIRVDDSAFDRRRLAPGFSAFDEGAYYRPTSSALNVDGNAVTIRITAPRGRRRPRVDVYPPSDYVKVRKRLRFYPRRRRRGRRRLPPKKKAKIEIGMRRRGTIMWLEIKGRIPHRMRPYSTRRAVYDPALNVGWALRRALVKAGIKVSGVVRRGRRPPRSRRLARVRRRLSAILRKTNLHSDNLAAETLVRAMGRLGQRGPAKKTWERGLARLTRELKAIGVEGFWLGNGSGLHRRSRVTARLMVKLLSAIYRDPHRRRMLLPTLSVAGRAGTLAGRMRHTPAEGAIKAKTGTLGGVLALSGYVLGRAEDRRRRAPLAFSILVNGKSNRRAKAAIDHIAELLARYVRKLPLSVPASLPASLPASRPVAKAPRPTARPDRWHAWRPARRRHRRHR